MRLCLTSRCSHHTTASISRLIFYLFFFKPTFSHSWCWFSHHSIPPARPFHQHNFDHQHKVQLPLKLSHISILASFRGRIRALMVSQPLIWTQQTAGSPSCLNLMIITGILSRNPHTSFLLNALMLIFTSLLDTCLWQWGGLVVQPSLISVIGARA